MEGKGPSDQVQNRENESRGLLADAREPPVVTPVAVVAVDAHVALVVAPPAEGGVTPLPVSILPVGCVGTVVGKGRIYLIMFTQSVPIDGLEAAQVELNVEVRVVDIPLTKLQIRFEEVDIHPFTLSTRHRCDDTPVGVLLAAGGVEYYLWCKSAIGYPHATGDDAAHRFRAAAKNSEHRADEFGLAENVLHHCRTKFKAMFFQHGAVESDRLVDLAVGDQGGVGWGHDLCHGVISCVVE